MGVTIGGDWCDRCSGPKYGEVMRISKELDSELLPLHLFPFIYRTHEYNIVVPNGRTEFKTKSCYVRYNKEAVAYSIDGKSWKYNIGEFKLFRKNKTGKLEEIAHSEGQSSVSK